MRIGDRTSAIAQAQVRIPKPGPEGVNDIILKVQALPMGFDETLEKELPQPNKNKLMNHVGYMKDPDTGRYIKEGGHPIREYEETPEWLSAVKKRNTLQLVAMLYHSIRDVNPGLEFETEEDPKARTKTKFYETLAEEMSAFGLTPGDIVIAVNKITEISNLTQDKIEEAKQDFLLDTAA